ncbi:hypothetical protein [Nocardia testacea]|uniref:hypothetical protein n=1 Tax=Nocardia testacea TaxID=248551 RepID=UPI003A8AA41D
MLQHNFFRRNMYRLGWYGRAVVRGSADWLREIGDRLRALAPGMGSAAAQPSRGAAKGAEKVVETAVGKDLEARGPIERAASGHGRVEINDRPTPEARDRAPGPMSQQPSPAARLAPLGENVSREAVVTGSSAMNLAFGTPLRLVSDLDVKVSEAAYRYLREQPGWSEHRFSDGVAALRNGDLEVMHQRMYEPSHGELAGRAWRTPEGIWVASLPDVYAYKDERRLAGDIEDLELMRARLLDPTRPPLPARVMQREIDAVRSFLPEQALNHPDADTAIRLAANGKHITSTLYGDPDIGRANTLFGDLERFEYQVPATYHNGFDLDHDGRLLQKHLDNIGAQPHERLDAAVADTYSDANYGDGRKKNNPDGYDELRAGELSRAHALFLGYDPARADRIHDMILGTAFDEQTKAQAGKNHPDPLVQAIAGVDLQTLAEPHSLEGGFDLAPEDLSSARHSPDRILGRTMIENDVRIRSTEEGMRHIDGYANYRPVIDGRVADRTVMDAFANRIAGDAGFRDPVKGHQYPPTWTLDNPQMRAEHTEAQREIAAKLADRDITATQAHQMAEQHGQAMQEKYGSAAD